MLKALRECGSEKLRRRAPRSPPELLRQSAVHDQGMTLEEAVAAKPLDGIDRGEGGFISADSFVTAIWNSIEG